MDFATIFGLVMAVGAITGAYTIEGGDINSIFILAPMMIVLGGTFGATAITTSLVTVNKIPTYLKLAFFGKKTYNAKQTIHFLVSLAEKARREGVLGLEKHIELVRDPFFKKAIRLVVDGTELTSLREILENEIAYLEDRHKSGIILFQKAGGFAPTMGILGTVLGLVQTLGNTSDAAKMATAIAGAFIATLWGVGLANLFLLPVSDKLKMRHEEELAHYELVMEGILSIQSGDNPRSIKTRLNSFVPPEFREE